MKIQNKREIILCTTSDLTLFDLETFELRGYESLISGNKVLLYKTNKEYLLN